MAGIFDSGGGDNTMTVTITGNAAGAAAATQQAAQSLAQLAQAAQQSAGQINEAMASTQGAFTGDGGLAGTAQIASASLQESMGAVQESMAATAAGAEESFLGVNGLASVLQRAGQAAQTVLGNGATGMMTFLGNVGTGLKSAGQGFLDLGNHVLKALNPMNLFTSGIGRMLEVMAGWRLMEGGIQQIGQFASGIFQLPIEMEKAQGSWQYMFNPQRTAGQSMQQWMAQGQGISQDISNWTMKESINLPYTRQDLIQAITSLAPAGLSSQGIEHYLPIIGDIAAAQNPNLNLQQAAYSVMGAMMGYSRMLRYDLHINPEQLTQYGYDQSNNATLLPALQKFAEARGLTSYNAQGTDTGAAYNISHSTFWGEWSSFIDRVQNSQIMTGDYGPFQQLKNGLEWVNNYIDTHSSDIEKFSHLLGDTLASGMKDVANAGQGFVQGLQQSGALTGFVDGFSSLGKWLADPATQKGIEQFTQMLGKPIGDSLRGLQQGLGAVGQGLGRGWQSLGKGGQQGLLNLLSLPGDAATIFGPGLGANLDILGELGGALGDLVHGDFKGAGRKVTGIPQNIIRDDDVGDTADTIMGWFGDNTHHVGRYLMNYDLTHWDQLWGQAWNQGFGLVGHRHPGGTPTAAPAPGGAGAVTGALAHTITAGAAAAQAAYDRAHAPDTLHQDDRQTRQMEVQQRAMHAAATQADQMRAQAEQHTNQMRQHLLTDLDATKTGATQSMRQMALGVTAAVGSMHAVAATLTDRLHQEIAGHLQQTASAAMAQGKRLHDNYLEQVRSLSDLTTRQMQSMRDQTNGVLRGMASDAAQWGANLVQELANGMLDKKAVADRAARDIAGALHNNLGFGSPTKEGPGSTADRWAPNFMRMFNAGLLAGLPQLAQTAAQIAAAMNPLAGGLVGGAPSYAYNTAYGAQTTNFHLYGLDPSAVQQVVQSVLARNNDQGNRMLRRPGNYGRMGWIG